jgi:hypothetical protein
MPCAKTVKETVKPKTPVKEVAKKKIELKKIKK